MPTRAATAVACADACRIVKNEPVTLTDERRLVTVLFADVVGFTGRAERSDPEAVREFQQRYFAAVAAQVERFGGTIEKYIGDAAMAIFGAPVAHDDDAERALRAALHIRTAVAELDPELEVRIGVNTGEVVGGMGSGPQAGDYTVSGDAVNVAARLQQTAQPNEVLVGATTRNLSAEAFTFDAVPVPAINEDLPVTWTAATGCGITAILAVAASRPVAKALGSSSGTIQILGRGIPDAIAISSTTLTNCFCSGVAGSISSQAPMDQRIFSAP